MEIKKTVEKLELKPGDILLVRFPVGTKPEARDRGQWALRRTIEAAGVDDRVAILGCENDLEIKLIRCAEES